MDKLEVEREIVNSTLEGVGCNEEVRSGDRKRRLSCKTQKLEAQKLELETDCNIKLTSGDKKVGNRS